VIAKRQTPDAKRQTPNGFRSSTAVSPSDWLFFFLADISDFRPLVSDEVHSFSAVSHQADVVRLRTSDALIALGQDCVSRTFSQQSHREFAGGKDRRRQYKQIAG
jgi:hypothetical protein